MRLRHLATAFLVALISAVLLTATLATPAEAATRKTWNRLAKCESGSRWHINSGNGYYGGLQISPGTWRANGGKRLARLPHKATKSEQIRVAKRIKNSQGWGAWPSCSRKIGVR